MTKRTHTRTPDVKCPPHQLIVGIIIMHNWWTDIKKHASNAVNAVGDVFDRRALMEEVEGRGVAREQEAVSPSGVEGRQEGLQDKVRRYEYGTAGGSG